MIKDAEIAVKAWAKRYKNIKQGVHMGRLMDEDFYVDVMEDVQYVFAHDKEYDQIHITTKYRYDKEPSFYDTYHCMLDMYDGEDEQICLWADWKAMAKEFEEAGIYPEPDAEAQWSFEEEGGQPKLEKMLKFLRSHNKFTELEFNN